MGRKGWSQMRSEVGRDSPRKIRSIVAMVIINLMSLISSDEDQLHSCGKCDIKADHNYIIVDDVTEILPERTSCDLQDEVTRLRHHQPISRSLRLTRRATSRGFEDFFENQSRSSRRWRDEQDRSSGRSRRRHTLSDYESVFDESPTRRMTSEGEDARIRNNLPEERRRLSSRSSGSHRSRQSISSKRHRSSDTDGYSKDGEWRSRDSEF